jgi:hypothetical protein
MRLLFAAPFTAALALALASHADDKGTTVELAGMKSVTPASWKEEPLPPKSMRMMQFKLPKAEGDSEDAELALFALRGGGSVQANLERQEKKFDLGGKKAEDAIKTDKIKVGSHEAVLQDIKGTLLKKFPPFDPNAKITRVPDYEQIYVIFEAKEGDGTILYSMTLLGPAKTVEKHKKEFEGWLKNFK